MNKIKALRGRLSFTETLTLIAGTCLLTTLDQVSKLWAQQLDGKVVPVFDWLNLILRHNRGIAFGWFSDTTLGATLITCLIVAACLSLGIWLWHSQTWRWQQRLALSAILAGALGNLSDRLFHGAVIDFIDFHIHTWHFATFNLADSWISLGACLLLLYGVPPTPWQKPSS